MESAPGSSELRKSVFAACQYGDIPALKLLFQEHDINPDHSRNEWDMPDSLTEAQRPPCVSSMLATATEHRQIATVAFLYTTFRNANNGPLAIAIETGDLELVRTMCKLDPAAVNGETSHMSMLAFACCSDAKNPEIVRILLEHGADPNKPAPHAPLFSNAWYAVMGDMPASTFTQFIDAGYALDDPNVFEEAVRKSRADVLEVLFARGKDLPTARYPARKTLIGLRKGDKAMVALIKSKYPTPEKKGWTATIVRALRS